MTPESDGVEDDPQGWTFWKIKHGIRWTGMPSWGHELNDQEIWTLALFLKHMDKLSPRQKPHGKILVGHITEHRRQSNCPATATPRSEWREMWPDWLMTCLAKFDFSEQQ